MTRDAEYAKPDERYVRVRCIVIRGGSNLTGAGLDVALSEGERVVNIDHSGGFVFVYVEGARQC
jgi:hypothetical protein